jgi:Fe-S-cluster containining protein
VNLDPAHVYFTWPDRGLSYRCAGCGACCKGLGIGLDAAGGQLVALTSRRPALISFLRRRGDAVTAFNPRDRCWFLADDGMCRIEVEDGRAAKPASCRLFPFNRVFTLGEITVVDYNSVICPLRIGGDGVVAHADILGEIATIRDPAIVGTLLPADPGGAAILAAERELSLACFAAAAAGELTPAIAGDDTAVGPAFTAILGEPWRAPTGATLAAALTLAPSLRFNELWGPRQYAARGAMRGVLPGMTRAWLGFAAIGVELAGRALGMQELTTLWSEQAALAYAAARWTDVPAIKPGPLELPGVDPGGVVRALGQAIVDNRKARRALGTIAGPILAAASPIERVTALKLAEPVLRAAFA